MMKKFLYHGGFAALGISLLMGMAALQTNNRTRLGNTLSMGDSSEPPVSDVMADEPSTISQTITKDAAPLASVLPETKRGLKPGVPTKVIPMTSSQAKVTAPAKKGRLEVIKKPGALNTASTFLVYALGKESSTKKTFTPTPNGIRHAGAYAVRVGHAVIKAKINGKWTMISAGQLKMYVADTVGE